MTKNYTYATFAQEVMVLLTDEHFMDAIDKAGYHRDSMYDKAQALYEAQVRKAEYNATHPRKSTAKGPSEKTAAVIAAIKPVLGAEPMTAADINAALGTTYTALMVANAVKYIDGVTACKVVRTTTNSKGLKADKEYTAYKLG